ncbi:MAG: hypothetical protein AAF430_06985 [Myxococcota bacterium]
MPGTVYSVPPIPPDPQHTTYVDAGTLRFGVEWRLLDDAELAANYEGEAMDEIQANLKTDDVDDHGVSIHVLGAGDGHEYLRFDCFREGPHYHYIEPSGERQTIVDFDPAALGEMLPWTLGQLRHRLGPMLTYSGGAAIASELDTRAIDTALDEVARLAEAAERALAAQGK